MKHVLKIIEEIYISEKKEANEPFGRKMNQEVIVITVKEENCICIRIKDKIQDLYSVDTKNNVTSNKCGFEGTKRGNYFG